METHIFTYDFSYFIENFLRAKAAFQDGLNALNVVINRIRPDYNQRVRFGLDLIAENAVVAFYDSYAPHKYRRQEGLFKAYKITATNDEWKIEMGPEFMETSYKGVGPDYIYINSFEKGFHGGAIDGPDHPAPGEHPWWKLHGLWYKPATSGPAPLETILGEASTYLDRMENEFAETALNYLNPYVKRINMIMDSF